MTIDTTETIEIEAPGYRGPDLILDRARSGSVLMSAHSERGRLFIKRIYGSYWEGRCAFLSPGRAEDVSHSALQSGLVIALTVKAWAQ